MDQAAENRNSLDKQLDIFRSELGWREFSYSMLHFNPELKTTPLQPRFAHFGWIENAAHLEAWQRGQTGYPIIDAGMRELYQTGYMHNRVRMIVGSFLVKNLLLHWHHGEAGSGTACLMQTRPITVPAGNGLRVAGQMQLLFPCL